LNEALTDNAGGAENAYPKFVIHEMNPVWLCLFNLILTQRSQRYSQRHAEEILCAL